MPPRACYGPPMNIEERFESKVDRSGDCHLWTAARCHKGYGRFGIKKGTTCLAHRFAVELSGREVPPGSVVRHTCDNPPCVNPAHLVVGTQAENVQDMKGRGRGRWAKGETHFRAKLTQDQVREIRDLLAWGGMTQAKIGPLYGVDCSTVSNIKTGDSWKEA